MSNLSFDWFFLCVLVVSDSNSGPKMSGSALDVPKCAVVFSLELTMAAAYSPVLPPMLPTAHSDIDHSALLSLDFEAWSLARLNT